MKISQRQAGLLAKEILNQLKRQNPWAVPEATISKLKEFKKKRDVLLSACEKADTALEQHDKGLYSIIGHRNDKDRIYGGQSVDQIVDKMKEQKIPRLSEIEDEIILQSMFANEDDMQEFINKIVKKYAKKAQIKQPQANQN